MVDQLYHIGVGSYYEQGSRIGLMVVCHTLLVVALESSSSILPLEWGPYMEVDLPDAGNHPAEGLYIVVPLFVGFYIGNFANADYTGVPVGSDHYAAVPYNKVHFLIGYLSNGCCFPGDPYSNYHDFVGDHDRVMYPSVIVSPILILAIVRFSTIVGLPLWALLIPFRVVIHRVFPVRVHHRLLRWNLLFLGLWRFESHITVCSVVSFICA